VRVFQVRVWILGFMPTVRLGKGNKREEIMGDKNTLELSPWFSSHSNLQYNSLYDKGTCSLDGN
jgi:hypothetical protein